MLTERSITSAHSILEKVEEVDRHIELREGSILEEVIRSSVTAETHIDLAQKDLHDFNSTSTLLTDSRANNEVYGYLHDAAMEATVTRLTEVMTDQLNLARSYAIPSIKSVLDRFGEKMGEIPIEANEAATVIPNIYHGIWDTNELVGLTQRYHNVAFESTKAPFVLPNLAEGELRDMINVGIPSLDVEIEDWYKNLPENTLSSVYTNFYVKADLTIGNAISGKHVTLDGGLNRDELLALFLITINFENKLPDGVNLELSKLRLGLATVTSILGRIIGAELKRRNSLVENKVLVYATGNQLWEVAKTSRTTIYVNNDVYVRFLEEGGSYEALCGAAIAERNLTWAVLMENKEELERIYARNSEIHAQTLNSRVFRVKREALSMALSGYIASSADEDLPSTKEDVQSRVTKRVNAITPAEFANEATIIRKVVCDVLYPDSNVGMFLEAMDEAEETHPEATPEECALYARIDLMARYLADQIRVKYNSL